jgi:Flp pilus assembly protein TadD
VKEAPPAFTPAGMHGTIAPSGYSTGLSSEEAAQVLNHVNDLTANLISTYLPGAADIGCDKEVELTAAVHSNPNSFSANHGLGHFYLVHGEAAKSVRYLKQSYSIAPNDVPNARDLGVAMIVAEQYANAVSLLQRLAAENNSDSKILRLLALSYAALGDVQKAIAEYKHASMVDASTDNLFASGIGLIGVGEGGEAEQLFSVATQASPGSAKLWTGLGIAQEIQHQKKDAVRSLMKAIDLDPNYIPPYSLLAGLSDLSPDQDSGIRQRLATLVAAQPHSAEAHYDYALALWKQQALGSPGVGISDIQSQLQQAIELDPKMVRAHFQRGVILADSGDYAEAATEFEEVVKLEPDNAQGHYRLAQAYRHEQKTEQANLEMKLFLELHGPEETRNDTTGLEMERIISQQSHSKASASPCPTKPN